MPHYKKSTEITKNTKWSIQNWPIQRISAVTIWLAQVTYFHLRLLLTTTLIIIRLHFRHKTARITICNLYSKENKLSLLILNLNLSLTPVFKAATCCMHFETFKKTCRPLISLFKMTQIQRATINGFISQSSKMHPNCYAKIKITQITANHKKRQSKSIS